MTMNAVTELMTSHPTPYIMSEHWKPMPMSSATRR
jgi:hypothetical protein